MGDPRYLMGTQKPAAQTAATTDDPLFTLLQRFEAELAAFNEATATPEQDWDNIAETTWSASQDEILERKPEATTAAGALLALDHVLKNELFEDREEFADQQMLWLLIKAARDYIAGQCGLKVGRIFHATAAPETP